MASSPQKNLQFISPPKEAGDFLQNQVKRRKEGVRSRITHKIYQSFAPGLISIKISNTRRIDSKIELLFNQFAM